MSRTGGRAAAATAAAGLAGTVKRAAELVEYQDGSVVSRTIVKGDTGTVTLFAFDRDQALSEHTVPYDALVYILEGEAEVTISGDTQRLASGDVIIMPASQPHAVRAVERFKMMLVMIRS